MDMEKLVALCKRRGFIFQSSEIYGGINGFWDYCPLGVELKKNIKDAWWHDMVRNPPPGPDGQEIEMVGVDCALIMNPKVWVASGHVGGFADQMESVHAHGMAGGVNLCGATGGLEDPQLRLELDRVAAVRLECVTDCLRLIAALDRRQVLDRRQRRHRRRLLARCSWSFDCHPFLLACSCHREYAGCIGRDPREP